MGKNEDVTALTPQALRVHIERCERLIKQPVLLSRLPDGGSGIRDRYAKYVAELERRAKEASAPNQPEGGDVSAHGVGENDSSSEVGARATTYEEEARIIGERYRSFKVPVEDIVRRTFGGSLCDSEVERILSEVPPNFFLTYEETMLMERKLMEAQRAETLERLRLQRCTGAHDGANGPS